MAAPPVGGLAPQQQPHQQQQWQQPQQQQQQQWQQQQQYPQQQQAPPGAGAGAAAPAAAAAPPQPAPVEEEEEPEPLPAMPTEFQPIVNMFNEKLQACLKDNKNSTFKRKLEDSQKRFSPLYHAMAYRQVDQTLANGLHQLAYALQSKDYATATNWHQYLMQQGTPTDLGATMIGIKGLIHVAKSMCL